VLRKIGLILQDAVMANQ